MQKLEVRHAHANPGLSFWELFMLPLMRYRRLTYTIVGAAMLITSIYCLFIQNQYTATATILPSGKPDQLAQLGQIAAGTLADVGLGSVIQAQENSSALYPKILSSRLIGEKVLQRDYTYHNGNESITLTLQDYIGSNNTDIALRKLAEMVSIGFDRTTGFITLSVTTIYPELSAAVAGAYLDELNNYNINYRQSKARDNERFVAQRLHQVRQELQDAEDSLKSLQQQNLNYMSAVDPTLRADLSRLEREVKIKEAVFLTLSEKFELAKLEAVKDVPVVQVLDHGEAPTVKSAPRRSVYLLGTFIGSLFGAIIICLWLDFAAKRQLRTQLRDAVVNSDLKMNRFEMAMFKHVSRLSGTTKQSGHTTNKVPAISD
jgi:uncharacterized protein involved in exopolysaccharide biosynthesis